MLEEFRNKKILILGFGREGQDTFKFLRKLFPGKKIDIADQRFDKNYLNKLNDYDLIIKSPGIPFKILPKSSLNKITTQTEIFFDSCPGKIIGVTGTKGKSTTSSLIYEILKKAGFKVHLIGNIGKPVLSFLLKAKKHDIFVYELSSHQLYNLKKSPQIAVLLNIYKEHLDYYRNFKDYIAAKANITKYQSNKDFFIYNSRNLLVKRIAGNSLAKKIGFQGKYYSENTEAAKKVAEIFKVPKKTVSSAIGQFKFLPHRLEYVGEFKGIKFYNDSLATVPGATIGALDYLKNNVQTLILGGYDRGLDFKKLGRKIAKSNIKTLILFPDTGKKIWKQACEAQPRTLKHFFVKDMKTAVKLAYKNTEKERVCLLSPASASFNLFKDYEERGNLFKKYVKMLK